MTVWSSGSSPRVWGIPVVSTGGLQGRRFIPTRVGNTTFFNLCSHLYPVHPHACGEYKQEDAPGAHGTGSSPRVWGILPVALQFIVEGRFIPTRVGNTASCEMTDSYVTVHPHACGEYVSISVIKSTVCGSSPRVWGIHFSPSAMQRCVRFIPTRVGNTSRRVYQRRASAVHPHACGEYAPAGGTVSAQSGSSPRVWGIRRSSARRCRVSRFIPTRVGNTADRRTG